MSGTPVVTHRSCPDDWLTQFSLKNVHKGDLKQYLFLTSPQVYATIKEVATSKTHTVCAANKRQSHAYTSQTRAIELRIVTGKPGGPEKNEFIFNYTCE
jgi:hypothetical protein